MPHIEQYEELTLAEEGHQAALRAALSSGEAAVINAWVEAHENMPFLAFDDEEKTGPVLTHPREWTYALGQRSVAVVIARGEYGPLIVGPADVGQLALIKFIDRVPDRSDTVQW